MPTFPDQLLYIGGRHVPSQGQRTFEW